jgi:hypothetical protein
MNLRGLESHAKFIGFIDSFPTLFTESEIGVDPVTTPTHGAECTPTPFTMHTNPLPWPGIQSVRPSGPYGRGERPGGRPDARPMRDGSPAVRLLYRYGSFEMEAIPLTPAVRLLYRSPHTTYHFWVVDSPLLRRLMGTGGLGL